MAYIVKSPISERVLAGVIINALIGAEVYRNGERLPRPAPGFLKIRSLKTAAEYSLVYYKIFLFGDVKTETLKHTIRTMCTDLPKMPRTHLFTAVYGNIIVGDIIDTVEFKVLSFLDLLDLRAFRADTLSIVCDSRNVLAAEGFVPEFTTALFRLKGNYSGFEVPYNPGAEDRILRCLTSNKKFTATYRDIRTGVNQGKYCSKCACFVYNAGTVDSDQPGVNADLYCISCGGNTLNKCDLIKVRGTMEEALGELRKTDPERAEMLHDLQNARRQTILGVDFLIGKKYVYTENEADILCQDWTGTVISEMKYVLRM